MASIESTEPTVQDENLIKLPENAGQAVVQSGAMLACPLLGTDSFVSFCSDRNLKIDRERLIRLERLGVFAPVFRVQAPEKETSPFCIPVRENNWFVKGWAWDTTGVPQDHKIPNHKDRTQEGYYSIFQIAYLHLILKQLTLQLHIDGFLESAEQESIDWQKSGANWLQYAMGIREHLRIHEHRRSETLLCQFISNRYYPQSQGDQRTIVVTQNPSYSDKWIVVTDPNWNWQAEIQNWDPHIAESLFSLTPKKLRQAYIGLAAAQKQCDPIEHWYQLTQFVSVQKRRELKGDALLAETLRSACKMLGHLYKDLYDDELPNPNEIGGMIRNHFPELSVRQDRRRYLEFVANQFGINPRPKLSLIVEGKSEEIVVHKIFEKCFGSHPGTFEIEIIVLGGVGIATGNKKYDRFQAIFRLIDYLHHHQTLTFLILDNENHAKKLKQAARKTKSTYGTRKHATRSEYIHLWKRSFEFDNCSCAEIAAAMNSLCKRGGLFNRASVLACKKDNNPGRRLAELYRQRTNHDLPKLALNEILVEKMLSGKSRRRMGNRPITKILDRIARLAALNPFPSTQKIWKINQASIDARMNRHE